jgi:hypothetical protein
MHRNGEEVQKHASGKKYLRLKAELEASKEEEQADEAEEEEGFWVSLS